MFRKHIPIVLTCIGLLGSVGCTPPQVKRLAIQVHFATEEKLSADHISGHFTCQAATTSEVVIAGEKGAHYPTYTSNMNRSDCHAAIPPPCLFSLVEASFENDMALPSSAVNR